ncbi:uncharacterized protein [Diadema antillarum]|uniref:uncharacterized protein isoform X1 n=1 Tax=Diadema antillarum TaxID=105358 RepID=UPI003A8B0A22
MFALRLHSLSSLCRNHFWLKVDFLFAFTSRRGENPTTIRRTRPAVFKMVPSASILCRITFLIFLSTFHHVVSTPTPSTSCASQPCQNGGSCTAYASAFLCRCTTDFTGLRCEIPVVNAPSATACDDNPCAHGACVSSASDRFTCMCPAQWRGTACEVDVDECSEWSGDLCGNGTVCINEDGGYRCEDPCASPNPCENGGTCSITHSDPYYTCECGPNHEGDNCDILVETDDACSEVSNMCHNGGTCFSFGGAALCYCLPGYQGEQCEIDTDVCQTITCQNGGTCQKSPDQTATCICPPFYSGPNCATPILPCEHQPCNSTSTCIEDLTLVDGYRCMSPCVKEPCQHGGTCTNDQEAALGFRCDCGPDYQGVMCEEMIPPCSREPCLNGGACEADPTEPEGYRCSCGEGFEGATCEVVVISPCASDPCENGGTCSPAEGAITEFRCTCPQGYQGDYCEVVLHLCTFEGDTYQDGGRRKEECNECHCQEGSWHCTDKFCGELIVSFAFVQTNSFDDDQEFSETLKEDIAGFFDINVDMIHVLTVSGDPSEVKFQLKDTVDSDVNIENVAADMLRQFVTGTYEFHYNQASYSVNSRTVVIEQHDGDVEPGPTDDGSKFINTTLIAVCVVVSLIFVSAVLFGITLIVVYKRRSRTEKICSRKNKNTNASNNVAGGAVKIQNNVYNRVPPNDVPLEVTEIRLQNGRKPDVNIHMEAKV